MMMCIAFGVYTLVAILMFHFDVYVYTVVALPFILATKKGRKSVTDDNPITNAKREEALNGWIDQKYGDDAGYFKCVFEDKDSALVKYSRIFNSVLWPIAIPIVVFRICKLFVV